MPQRRNRVYLVADLAGQRAGEILFEQEGLRRDSAQGGTAREGSAADVEGGFGGSAGFLSGQGVKAHGIGYEIERTPTLRSQAGGNSVPCVLRTLPLQVSESKDYPVYMLQGNCIDREVKCNGCGWKKDISFTLNTVDRHGVCYQNTVGALCAADWRGPNSQYVGSDK